MNPSQKISFATAAAQIVKVGSAGRSRRTIAKMKRSYDADPAWNRGGSTVKKKRNMCSRATLRKLISLMKKRKTDRTRLPICVTRTVELPSTQTIGIDRSKLLFMIAIGLSPNTAKPPLRETGEPIVRVERLDPAVESEAKARTKEVLHEIFNKRKVEWNRRRASQCSSSSQSDSAYQSYDDNVEVVDLVSDEDRSSQSGDESEEEQHSQRPFPRRRPRARPYSYDNRDERSTTDADTSVYKIITCQPRKTVFKQLANNQESGVFRNWKPDSMAKLMNLKKSDKCNSTSNGSQSKLLSALKSIPVSTLTVRNYASNLAADASCKSQTLGAQDEREPSSVPRSKKLEYIVPAKLITTD